MLGDIELINLVKKYDNENLVIDNVSTKIKSGEFFVLVGPSGSGKSTLLRMISGLEEITDGTLKIDGNIVNNTLPKDRNLTMVFQNYALYPNMTVRDNILFGLDVKKVPKDEQEKRLKETAEMVGLTEFLKRKPSQLSGGQRQRVALARSICSKAPLFLMDEPLSNLDAKLRTQMRTEIRNIQRKLGLTMVYVTHDQLEAMTMGDRIMVLNHGEIAQVGTPEEVYNHPKNLFTATFIGSPQMNTFDAKIRNNTLIIGEAIHIKLSEEDVNSIPKEKDIIVGIRPEHIIHGSEEDNIIRLKVLNTEFLGNETQLVLLNGSQQLVAKWPGQWNIPVESVVPLYINSNYLYIFDKNTGDLLRDQRNIQENHTIENVLSGEVNERN